MGVLSNLDVSEHLVENISYCWMNGCYGPFAYSFYTWNPFDCRAIQVGTFTESLLVNELSFSCCVVFVIILQLFLTRIKNHVGVMAPYSWFGSDIRTIFVGKILFDL